jgi:hypothetical protein
MFENTIKRARQLVTMKHAWSDRRGSESRKEIWYKVEKAQGEIDALRSCLRELLIISTTTSHTGTTCVGKKMPNVQQSVDINPNDRWISVNDHLPEHHGIVPVSVLLDGDSESIVSFDRFENGKWIDLGRVVLHWFNLPNSPKGVKHE